MNRRRLSIAAGVALALAAPLLPAAIAEEDGTIRPVCADIVDTSNGSYIRDKDVTFDEGDIDIPEDSPLDEHDPDDTWTTTLHDRGTLTWTMRLAAPSCKGAVYTMLAEAYPGAEDLQRFTRRGDGRWTEWTISLRVGDDPDNPNGNYPQNCVFLTGTSQKGVPIDVAPDDGQGLVCDGQPTGAWK